MPVIDIAHMPDFLRPRQTIAGLDLGTKTIGLAVSDIGLSFANPRPMIKRTKFNVDAKALLDFFTQENVGVAVIGLPVNMNGSAGPRVQSTHAFVRNVLNIKDFPFIFWDERLSTVAAERCLIDMNVSRLQRATRIDSAAATFILQGVLDHLRWSSSIESHSLKRF